MTHEANRFILWLGTALLLGGVLLALRGDGLPAGWLAVGQGRTAYRSEAYGDAEVHFRQGLGTEAAGSGLRQHLGSALYHQGRYREAAHCYAQALRTAPPAARAALWANLGLARYRAGQLVASYAAYGQAVRLAPADAATRQDFLLVAQRLAAQQPSARPPAATPNKPEAARPDRSDEPPGKAMPPADAVEQPLTDQYMQDVFGRIGESERQARSLLRGAGSRVKNSASNEKDY